MPGYLGFYEDHPSHAVCHGVNRMDVSQVCSKEVSLSLALMGGCSRSPPPTACAGRSRVLVTGATCSAEGALDFCPRSSRDLILFWGGQRFPALLWLPWQLGTSLWVNLCWRQGSPAPAHQHVPVRTCKMGKCCTQSLFHCCPHL